MLAFGAYPSPNAWLGNLKNVDLVKEFGGDEGFWKSFSDGVENIQSSYRRRSLKLNLKNNLLKGDLHHGRAFYTLENLFTLGMLVSGFTSRTRF